MEIQYYTEAHSSYAQNNPVVVGILNALKEENPQYAEKLWSLVSFANSIENVADESFFYAVGDFLHQWDQDDFGLSECTYAVALETAAILSGFSRMEASRHLGDVLDVDDEIGVEAKVGGTFNLIVGNDEVEFDDVKTFLHQLSKQIIILSQDNDVVLPDNFQENLYQQSLETFPNGLTIYQLPEMMVTDSQWKSQDVMTMLYQAAENLDSYSNQSVKDFMNKWYQEKLPPEKPSPPIYSTPKMR